MEKRYRVTLTEQERGDLQKLVSTGKAAAKKLVRARIVLLADQADGRPGRSDPEIVQALGCGRVTVACEGTGGSEGPPLAPGGRQSAPVPARTRRNLLPCT